MKNGITSVNEFKTQTKQNTGWSKGHLKNVFNVQWRKICCCWKIYYDFKNKIFKHMRAVTKNVYFDVLDNIVDKYNNTYQ